MTPGEFRAAMPEFSTSDDPIIQRAIDESPIALSIGRWGIYYDRGLRYWIAHEVTMELERRAAGTMAKAGDVTYLSMETTNGAARSQRDAGAVAKQMENPYQRTQYGQEFHKLLRIVGAGTLATT